VSKRHLEDVLQFITQERQDRFKRKLEGGFTAVIFVKEITLCARDASLTFHCTTHMIFKKNVIFKQKKNRLCIVWKAENDIQSLDWSAQSSDANLNENVWSIIKRKLQGKCIFTLKQLCHHVRAIWRLPQQYTENFIKNMPKRCQQILDNNGDWTN